jgi:hypothetical protein
MQPRSKHHSALAFALLFGSATALAYAFAIAGCSADGIPASGDVELGLTAAPTYTVQSLPTGNSLGDITGAVVIVKEVDVHVAGTGWVPVLTSQKSIDLLALDHQTFSSLGVAKLPLGHIDQLRLLLSEIGDYVTLKSGVQKPLEVPANGIVLVDGKLDVKACASGVVIIDFDPHLKTEDEPGRREYELLPEAKVKASQMHGACSGVDGGHPADLANPPKDGGPCSVACAPGEVCMNGMCVTNPCAGVACQPGETCSPSDGQCHPTDPCAGINCQSGETCVNGQCVPAGQDAGVMDAGSSCHSHH